MKPIYLISHEIVKINVKPCVGLGYIAAYLQSKEINVEVFDGNYLRQSPYDFLRDKAPGIVGITCESRNFEEAIKIASFAKKRGHITVLGGLHVCLVEGQVLDYPDVDFAITGDGEIPFYKLAETLNEEKNDFNSIPGLIFRQHSEVYIQEISFQDQVENRSYLINKFLAHVGEVKK